MARPYIVGISGESGVGKTTISEAIALFFAKENLNTVTIISSDDLHKWERSNLIWKDITHLNPEANNLELGDIHLSELAKGNFIYRSVYNHKTGYFNPPIKIEPKNTIIVEGLHAFYTEQSKRLIDLKIFIDTSEELRIHWKIIRDTEERGYKYNVVLDTINKRRLDSNKIRAAQINEADAVIKIDLLEKIKCIGDKKEKVNFSLSISNEQINKELFAFIKNYMC